MKGRVLAIIGTWLKLLAVALFMAWAIADWVMPPVIDGDIQTELRLRDLH